MTAFYNLGYEFAESQEEAERKARTRVTCFTPGEKTLIHARVDNG